MYSHNIISYHIISNIIYYITKHYYIIIVVYDINLSNVITRLLLVMTNLHISLEAVKWRLVQVTFEYLG